MKTKSYLFFSFSIASIFFILAGKTQPASARENATNWYIQNFDTEITVNKDSTLEITEKITADCGACVGKHGIFRILPEDLKISGQSVSTPVELMSISDFSGSPLKYSETKNRSDTTVTWKIGDPDRTVQGINQYRIRYQVKNAIRFGNAEFDEFYWNLLGNFWDLEIDKFSGKIIFPTEVSQGNSTVDYYTGNLGAKGEYLANYRWTAPNVLEFNSTGTFKVRQGLTASVTFPKNIFTPYVPSFWEKYGSYLFLLLPLGVFLICFRIWWKYGKDPKVDKAVIPEYAVPGDLSPIELGMLMENGALGNELITAEIVNLAVNGLIKIKEVNNKIIFFSSKNYEFERIKNQEAEAALNSAQRLILERIFGNKDSVKLLSLKNNFYKYLKEIKAETDSLLSAKKLILMTGAKLKAPLAVIGIILMASALPAAGLNVFLTPSLLSSGLIAMVFGYIMPKRTPEGAELNWKIKGFRLFMETVDKHRAEFYEKENIFEKFLPFAIVFGMTKLWIKKMKKIYGENYYNNYTPAWYAGNTAAFDADSFGSTIDGLSSDIAANTSSPSGSGGGGGAGGGGGGGGGGGW